MATSTAPNGSIHARAQAGFANSAAYDLHRPTYSPTIVQFLLETLQVAGKRGARIVDLAAGTGKFTEALAARDEKFHITAVEPHAGMREVLAGKNLRGVTVVNGTADAMPEDDESVDAVFVAQSFHWFANMSALREIHRVLHPHGGLGLVWNIEDYNSPKTYTASTPWESQVRDLTFRLEDVVGDHEPRFRHLKWREVFDEQVKATPMSLIIAKDQLFSLPIGEHTEPFEVTLPVDHVWERYNTIGHIAVLEGEEREQAHKTFMDSVGGADVKKNEKGEVIIHGNTYAIWTMKIPAEGRESLTSVEKPS